MTETPHTTESQAEKNQQPASPDPQPRKKGPLHWLRVNLTKILGGFIKRHKLGVALAAVTALVCVFLTRALWQHYVLAARQQSGVMLILLVVLIIAVFSFKFKPPRPEIRTAAFVPAVDFRVCLLRPFRL